MDEKLQKLLKVVTDPEKAEVTILNNAVVTNARQYRDEPTAANKRDWDAARNGLDTLLDRLWKKYFEPEAPDAPAFKNRLEALAHLQDQGYKIQKSKLYNDCKAGLLKVEADGRVLHSAVKRYIHHPEAGLEKHLETVAAGEDRELQQLSKKKSMEELDLLEIKKKKLLFEYEKEQGKWLPREDFELELAARAAVLENGLKYAVRSRAYDWIHLCRGRAEKYSELVGAIHAAIDQLLTEYASTRNFQVLILDDESSDDHPDAAIPE